MGRSIGLLLLFFLVDGSVTVAVGSGVTVTCSPKVLYNMLFTRNSANKDRLPTLESMLMGDWFLANASTSFMRGAGLLLVIFFHM